MNTYYLLQAIIDFVEEKQKEIKPNDKQQKIKERSEDSTLKVEAFEKPNAPTKPSFNIKQQQGLKSKESSPRPLTSSEEIPATLRVKKAPTEEDLSTGCFTDVSFAGTFATPVQQESTQGCFTEVSFAGTFAQRSLETSHHLIQPQDVIVNKVTRNVYLCTYERIRQ